jgi:GAF domain-containing protein
MDKARIALSDFTAAKAAAVDVHKAVCQDIVNHIGSTRASIWYFNDTNDTLTCACSLDTRTGFFDLQAISLSAQDSRLYFDEIMSKGVIKAVDVQANPATQSLKERYIAPLNIVSLFDCAIKIGPRPVAVLCCENCGIAQEWTNADENYLASMAVLLRISFLVEQRTPRR